MHYVVTATLRLPAGSVVGLGKAQVQPRQHMLVPIPKREGWFKAELDLCFKAGESIQYEGDLPKSLAHCVEAPKRRGKAEGGDKPPARTGKAEGGDKPPAPTGTAEGGDGEDTVAGGEGGVSAA